MDDRVTVNIHEGVADVRLVRADKMNALDNRMFEALRETARELGENKALRAVVLSGEGRAFCAGLDMGNFAGILDPDKNAEDSRGGKLADRTHGIANGPQAAAWVWRELPVPVIVPPVPIPATKMSTAPPVSRQISSAVVRR